LAQDAPTFELRPGSVGERYVADFIGSGKRCVAQFGFNAKAP
jgi:hypothetical protein